MKLGVGTLLVACLLAPPAAGQHFTARFFGDYGRPNKGERILFSPSSRSSPSWSTTEKPTSLTSSPGAKPPSSPISPQRLRSTPKGLQMLGVSENRVAAPPG